MDAYWLTILWVTLGSVCLVRNMRYWRDTTRLRHDVQHSLKARMWVNYLGLEKTEALSRQLFLPMGTLFSLVLLALGFFTLYSALNH